MALSTGGLAVERKCEGGKGREQSAPVEITPGASQDQPCDWEVLSEANSHTHLSEKCFFFFCILKRCFHRVSYAWFSAFWSQYPSTSWLPLLVLRRLMAAHHSSSDLRPLWLFLRSSLCLWYESSFTTTCPSVGFFLSPCLGLVAIPNLENSQPFFSGSFLFPFSILSLPGTLLRSMFDLLAPPHPPVSETFICESPRRLG